jgi:hypothetical protein
MIGRAGNRIRGLPKPSLAAKCPTIAVRIGHERALRSRREFFRRRFPESFGLHSRIAVKKPEIMILVSRGFMHRTLDGSETPTVRVLA